MMAGKKDPTMMYLLIAAAAAGLYYAYKNNMLPGQSATQATFTTTALPGIASELPNAVDVGVYTPSLDPTGQSLQLF